MAAERLRVVQSDEGDASSSPNQLTIEQLAHETGMSVRNIRAHQARGLLQPPEVRQRVGYYGPEHVARLRLIQELQADGFNLKGIERLLEGAHASSERLLHLKRAITAPFESEQPEVLSREELQEMFGEQANAEALERAVELGLLVPMADQRFEAPSPSLIATAREVMGHGVPLTAALEVVESVQKRCAAVAEDFVELFLKWVWRPFEEAGHPEERWEEVVESIERLRPIASDVLVAIFKQTMTEYVDRAFGEELGRISSSGGRRR